MPVYGELLFNVDDDFGHDGSCSSCDKVLPLAVGQQAAEGRMEP